MSGILTIIIPLIIILILTSIGKTRKLIIQYLSEFLTTIGAIGLTLIVIMSKSTAKFVGEYTWEDVWVVLLVIFGLVMVVAVFIGAYRNKRNFEINDLIEKNKNLQNNIELYSEEYYKLCSSTILFLLDDFFTTGGERVSIYKHQGNHFTLLGRYSPNPQYNRRTTYSYKDNEGLIGKAWDEGEATLEGAPKYVQNGTAYKKFMKERCTVTDKRLKKITMKSQSFYIKTLDDRNTAENPDGIIVFESMYPDKIKKEDCINLIEQNEKSILSLLKHMKSLTRKVS